MAAADQCNGDGALELGVLTVPTPAVDPRGWWKFTGLLPLLIGRGGRFLSAGWSDGPTPLDPERGKDEEVEGEESSPVTGLAVRIVTPEVVVSAR